MFISSIWPLPKAFLLPGSRKLKFLSYHDLIFFNLSCLIFLNLFFILTMTQVPQLSIFSLSITLALASHSYLHSLNMMVDHFSHIISYLESLTPFPIASHTCPNPNFELAPYFTFFLFTLLNIAGWSHDNMSPGPLQIDVIYSQLGLHCLLRGSSFILFWLNL